VLFAVPWHDMWLSAQPIYPLKDPTGADAHGRGDRIHSPNAREYLSKPPTRKDVLSASRDCDSGEVGDAKSTAALSRDHTILISIPTLLRLRAASGPTYRKMARTRWTKKTMAGLDERP